jgi:hypothetical protein
MHISVRESRTVACDWHRSQRVTETGTVVLAPQSRHSVTPFGWARRQHVDAAELTQLDARERRRSATLFRSHEVLRVQTAVPVAGALCVTQAVAVFPVHQMVPQA